MSTEEKTIHINMDALKIPSANKTRKKKETKQSKIRIKDSNKRTIKPSTLKRNILNIIRNSQHKKIKENKNSPKLDNENDQIPQTSFEESVKFMNTLKNGIKNDKKESKYNEIKASLPSVIPSNTSGSIVPAPAPVFNSNTNNVVSTIPVYGCLKNGSLPTFRTWKNQTQKNHHLNNNHKQQIVRSVIDDIKEDPSHDNYTSQLEKKIQQISEIDQMNELNKQDSNVIIKNKKPKKQKRIIRRTFKVGKSKHVPKVSVLISNKTLRNKANLQKQALRETSIKDVRRYLLKSGFIKVGTTTPNDVLREMYENAKLVCGDVKNHNPDNLLYNYFNDDEI